MSFQLDPCEIVAVVILEQMGPTSHPNPTPLPLPQGAPLSPPIFPPSIPPLPFFPKEQFRNEESPSFEATLNYNDPITPRTDVLLPRTSLHQQSGPDARISRQVSWRPADLQGDVLLPRTSLHQKSGPSAGFGETSFTWTVVDVWGFSDAVIGFDSANGTLAGWAN